MHARQILTAIVIATAAVACGQAAPEPAPANPNARPVDSSTAGSITGRITFTGTPPGAEVLRMGTDQACVDGSGPNPVSDAVLVSADGAVKNAFVHIKDGLDPNYTFEAPAEEVELDQRGCIYTPRVLGIRVGQTLKVLNSDPTMHNVHALPMSNIEFNKSTPVQGSSITSVFTVPEVMVRFMCNVHGWMAAWVGVKEHPYFAVTAADGTFTLSDVPPGTYTVEVWHEVFGTQTMTVTVADGQQQLADFAFAPAAGTE